MKICTAQIQSTSPYSSSRVIVSPRLPKEGADAHEERCWRERLNVDAEGFGFIPAQAFKSALDVAAKRYSPKIPGKGQSTYSKFIEAGVSVFDPIRLSVTRETVVGERLFVPADGVKGGPKRVWKIFPIINQWAGTVQYHVLDDTVRESVLEDLVRNSLAFIGVGRWRPERGGLYGRAIVQSFSWVES